MKIISIKEIENGEADITYELSEKEITLFKQIAKERKVKFSKKFCNELILEALKKYVEEK